MERDDPRVRLDGFEWRDNAATGEREFVPTKAGARRYALSAVFVIGVIIAACYGSSVMPNMPRWAFPLMLSLSLAGFVVATLCIRRAFRRERARGPLLAVGSRTLRLPRKGVAIPLDAVRGVRLVRGFLGWKGSGHSSWNYFRQGCVVWVDESGGWRETLVYWASLDRWLSRGLRRFAEERGLPVLTERVPRALYERVIERRKRW